MVDIQLRTLLIQNNVNYKIIQNFLPEQDSDLILDTVTSNSFSWFYSGSVGRKEDNKEFYFVHIFFDFFAKTNLASPEDYIISNICKNMRIPPSFLLRCKANLFTRSHLNFKHGLHKDIENKANTLNAIYYINTNNGYTEFENGTRIDSVRNSLLLFDNNTLHRSVNQTDEKIRLNINMNFDIDYYSYVK